MEVIIKAYLQEADAALEVRRIPVTTQNNGKGVFKEVFARVGNAFPGLVDKKYSLKWKGEGALACTLGCLYIFGVFRNVMYQ